jgi:hypothetical protein
MPWDSSDAKSKTKKANTPKKQRQWADVSNSALARGMSDKEAIMEANAVVKRNKGGKKK